ncbi:hypothetical protein AA313_de0202901 [Arthrobotrys entomopaga]|nr:hypothetical protein AA313_de0202901 [Arthrobotrys entomopaga]
MVTSEAACKSHLQGVIRHNKLERFYPNLESPLLEEIYSKAPEHLKTWGQYALEEDIFGEDEVKEYQFSMLALALASMHEVYKIEDENGQTQQVSRMETAKTLLRNIVELDSKIVEQGVKLHYLNDGNAPVVVKNGADLDQAFRSLRFHGATKLGTVLENKIWSKIIGDQSNFTKPCLVYIITDGEPVSEPKTKFKTSILDCKKKLEEAKYPSTAIAFGIAQVGDDQNARDFLEELHKDPQLKDHLDVVNEGKSYKSPEFDQF